MRLARDEYAMDVPQIKFKLEPIKHVRKFLYTDNQIKSMLAYCKLNARSMGDLLTILADTGCRLSEALNINAATDVREGMLMITVNKADYPRAIPLTSRCVTILQKRTDFHDLNLHLVERIFNKMKDKLLLPSRATLHCLRHTFATRLCEQGVSIDIVSKLLGHRQLQTTQIYAQITNYRLKDTVKFMER